MKPVSASPLPPSVPPEAETRRPEICPQMIAGIPASGPSTQKKASRPSTNDDVARPSVRGGCPGKVSLTQGAIRSPRLYVVTTAKLVLLVGAFRPNDHAAVHRCALEVDLAVPIEIDGHLQDFIPRIARSSIHMNAGAAGIVVGIPIGVLG